MCRTDCVPYRLCAVLTGVHEGVAGHGVTREGQFPARAVSEAAGEGVLTVMHRARLELRHTEANDE